MILEIDFHSKIYQLTLIVKFFYVETSPLMLLLD
jgi:hypothetical protein